MHIKNFDPYDFSKKEIAGVPVYYKNLPWAPCIHIRIQFSVGAFNDPVGKEGVAHFLEHVVGSGSPLLPNKKAKEEFSRLYMLNSRNASTSYNWTVYTGKCLPENFEKVLVSLMDEVINPYIRLEDVEEERKIITQESWQVYKNEKYLNFTKEMSENIASGHERSRIASPLGWPASIGEITQEDLRNFHQKNYVKGNFSLFLVGAIEESNLHILPDVLKQLPEGKPTEKNEGEIIRPKTLRIEKYSDEIGDPREQLEYALLRYTTEKVDEDTGHQTMDLLDDILFERLRTELSLCYGVHTSWSQYKGFSNGIIAVDTSEDKLKLVETEISKVLQEIIDGKWKERFQTLHKLTIDRLRSNERLSKDIIYRASKDLITYSKIETLKEIEEKIKRITYEDIVKFIKKVFDPQFVLTQVIYPSKN